jgi:hypothetical protein
LFDESIPEFRDAFLLFEVGVRLAKSAIHRIFYSNLKDNLVYVINYSTFVVK